MSQPDAGLAGRLSVVLGRQSSDFAKAARRLRAGTDAEAIHDVRVAARRLVATLRTWGMREPNRRIRAAIRSLRRCRRRLGPARELEVHVRMMEPLVLLHGPPAAAALARLRKRLERRRRRAMERTRGKRMQRVSRLLALVAADLERAVQADAGIVAHVHRLESAREAAARAAIAEALASDRDFVLHEGRLALKKWRYVIESIVAVLPAANAHELSHLREIQEVLGDFNDRVTLQQALVRVSAPLPPGALEPLLAELRDEEQEARRRFQGLAIRWFARTHVPSIAPVPVLAIGEAEERARVGKGEGSPDAPPEDRWERMASWLTQARDGEDDPKNT